MAGNRKKIRRFSISMQKKLIVLFILVLLAFVGLGLRLIYINQEKGEEYAKRVLSQQSYDSTTIPFRRGDIVDSKGTKLAVSQKVYNLVIDAKVMQTEVKGDTPYLEETLEALALYFPQLDISAIRAYVLANPSSSYYVPTVTKQMTYDEISSFEAAMSANSNIKGVWFEEEYERVYPYGSLAADVIGFVGSDNNGMYGLEEYYDDILNGTDGREYGYLNDDSTLERTIIAAVDGYTIHTTIDANIQSIVEKYLQEFMEEYKDNYREGNGAENVACIIEDINTGEILAMASYPTYDLNDVYNSSALLGSTLVEKNTLSSGYYTIETTDTVITEEVLSELTSEELTLQLNYLWKNFCISSTYEPGSTMKPFTVAAAIECGAITGNEVYQCNGYLEVGGYTIKCHTYASGGEGEVSVQNAIAWSCNVALMKIGIAMGTDEFTKFQRTFNFGLKTNIDLAGESRTASLVYTSDTMGASDLATNTFGQNINVTMIQMINGFCALINGGYYYEPHLVSKITDSSGATIETIEPRVLRQVISESTSDLIKQYCRAVVMEEGGSARTGKTARPAGYAIGGKTGTAETYPRGNGEYVVSFLGYAPADDPQIAIYVVVDRPNAAAQDDAKYATRIVRSILTEVLPYLNIYMTEELSDSELAELEALQLENTLAYTQSSSAAEDEDEEEETTTADEPIWMSYATDASTGYKIHPTTGELIDPETGAAAGGNFSALEDVPTNENIIEIVEEE